MYICFYVNQLKFNSMSKQQKVKDRLRELFPKANLSAKRLDELSERLSKKMADDADQTAIDEIINSANDFMPFEDIAKEDDRVRTLEQKAKANEGKQDPPKQDPPKNDEPPKQDDVPAWVQQIMDANKKLAEDIEAIKTGKITETKLQNAKKLFEQSDIFKSIKDENARDFFFKQVDPNSETPFEEQIKNLESTYSSLVQHQADSQDYAGLPPDGKANGKPTEAELDSIIANAGR